MARCELTPHFQSKSMLSRLTSPLVMKLPPPPQTKLRSNLSVFTMFRFQWLWLNTDMSIRQSTSKRTPTSLIDGTVLRVVRRYLSLHLSVRAVFTPDMKVDFSVPLQVRVAPAWLLPSLNLKLRMVFTTNTPRPVLPAS